MKYELHEACAAWPEMTPAELHDLADDIAKNVLREAIVFTPDGKLLDGRNRAEACDMAGVEPTTVVYDGDPWLFSLSKNRHRRHMTVDQIALVVAKLAMRPHGGDRRSGDFKASNEVLKIADAAKAANVPQTAIESAKAVLKHGAPDEIEAVKTGRAKLRKTADAARSRVRSAKKTSTASRDPIDDVMRELIAKCAGLKAEWRTVAKMSSTVMLATSAIKEALKRLGGAVKTRDGGCGPEYLIDGDRDALLARVESPETVSSALAAAYVEIADLKRHLAEKDAQIVRLTLQLDAAKAVIEREGCESAANPELLN
jgi:hypothetical protein